MIELFSLINNKRSKSIKIKCDSLSYWRSDRPTELVNYISNNIDKFCVEKFHVEPGYVYDDDYVKAFDIELYMDNEMYDHLMTKFQGTIAQYNKDIVDISLYEHRWE